LGVQGRAAQDAFPQREDFKNNRSCDIAAPGLDRLPILLPGKIVSLLMAMDRPEP